VDAYITAEARVKAACAGSAEVVGALNNMGAIALAALTQLQQQQQQL
jgi:hypothetical protein